MSNLLGKVIRLAYANPELRSHLMPLIKSARSSDLDSDTMESLEIIHKIKKVPFSLEGDVSTAWDTLNRNGEGYSIGDVNDDIEDVGDEAGKLIDTVDHGQIAVYWNRKSLTLVADLNGPWAVDIRM